MESRSRLVGAIVCGLITLSGVAGAQNYPVRPIRIVIP